VKIMAVVVSLGMGALLGLAPMPPLRAGAAPALRVWTEPGALHLEVALDSAALDDALPLRWPLADGRALPFAAWLVAVPDAQTLPAVTVQALDAATVSDLPLPAAAQDALAPALPDAWPLRVEPVGVMRGVALARVQFLPARPTAAGWEVVRALRATVRWPAPTGPRPGAATHDDDPLLRVVRGQVVNPQEVAPPPAVKARAERQSAGGVIAWIDVATPGLVAITPAALAAAGAAVGSPHGLRLRRGGEEVLMLWEGDGDDVFEAGERLLFYADPRFSRYADHDAWALEDVGAPVARLSTRDAAPGALSAGSLNATLTFEHNALYTPDCGCRPPAHRDGDRWAWANLQAGQSWTHAFTLPLAAPQPVTLTVWLIGYTDPPQAPDHRAQVWLNGALLGEVTWDGRQAITAALGGIAGAHNALSVTLPGLSGVAVEGSWVDAFAATFVSDGQSVAGLPLGGDDAQRAYTLGASPAYLLDVTTPTQPVRLANAAPVAGGVRFADPPAGLPRRYVWAAQPVAPLRVRPPAALNPAQGALHIVAPSAWLPELGRLVARRQAQGLSVVTQTLEAIYDHYGEGRPDPAAIRAYLAARYQADAVRPAYVLLVGDGTLDPKRYRPTTPPSALPPWLAEVDPFLGETAADNRFVTVDGDDALPDIALGRWPVNTLTETRQLVSKTLAYEDALLTPADRRVVIAADDADLAGDFPAKANALAAHVAAPYVAVTATLTGSVSFTATRAALLSQWNLARLLLYSGHASPRQWAAERLFHRDDVATLPRRAALPVVVGLTCYTARFHELQDALDETLLRADGRGAVATWGATGLTLSAGHDVLGQNLTDAWLAGSRLGDATLAGKLALAGGGLYLDLLDTYTLLGDPALAPGLRWAAQALYLPLTRQ